MFRLIMTAMDNGSSISSDIAQGPGSLKVRSVPLHPTQENGSCQDETRVSCPYCQEWMSGALSLKEHLGTHLPKSTAFECKLCKAQFKEHDDVKSHLRTTHFKRRGNKERPPRRVLQRWQILEGLSVPGLSKGTPQISTNGDSQREPAIRATEQKAVASVSRFRWGKSALPSGGERKRNANEETVKRSTITTKQKQFSSGTGSSASLNAPEEKSSCPQAQTLHQHRSDSSDNGSCIQSTESNFCATKPKDKGLGVRRVRLKTGQPTHYPRHGVKDVNVKEHNATSWADNVHVERSSVCVPLKLVVDRLHTKRRNNHLTCQVCRRTLQVRVRDDVCIHRHIPIIRLGRVTNTGLGELKTVNSSTISGPLNNTTPEETAGCCTKESKVQFPGCDDTQTAPPTDDVTQRAESKYTGYDQITSPPLSPLGPFHKKAGSHKGKPKCFWRKKYMSHVREAALLAVNSKGSVDVGADLAGLIVSDNNTGEESKHQNRGAHSQAALEFTFKKEPNTSLSIGTGTQILGQVSECHSDHIENQACSSTLLGCPSEKHPRQRMVPFTGKHRLPIQMAVGMDRTSRPLKRPGRHAPSQGSLVRSPPGSASTANIATRCQNVFHASKTEIDKLSKEIAFNDGTSEPHKNGSDVRETDKGNLQYTSSGSEPNESTVQIGSRINRPTTNLSESMLLSDTDNHNRCNIYDETGSLGGRTARENKTAWHAFQDTGLQCNQLGNWSPKGFSHNRGLQERSNIVNQETQYIERLKTHAKVQIVPPFIEKLTPSEDPIVNHDQVNVADAQLSCHTGQVENVGMPEQDTLDDVPCCQQKGFSDKAQGSGTTALHDSRNEVALALHSVREPILTKLAFELNGEPRKI